MKDFKILALDIETRPAKAYVWRMYDENIGIDQLIEPGRVICVGAKFVGQKGSFFFSEWEDGRVKMLKGIKALMAEADAILTYNGDRFDLPKLLGEFLLAGLEPPPPVTSIDIYKTVRKFRFDMNKLAYIAPYLNAGRKVKHEGFKLWVDVMNGVDKAQRKMKTYCIRDVTVLVNVYNKVRPFIKNHPHMGMKIKGHECGACGSKHLQSRGYRRTKSFRIQRLQCQTCGSWQDGKREKV